MGNINNWKQFNEEYSQANINNLVSDIQSKGYDTVKVEDESSAVDMASQSKEGEKKAFIGTQKIEGGFYYFVAVKNLPENDKTLKEVASECGEKDCNISSFAKGTVLLLKVK
jgi:hypothetical protein